MLCGGSRRIRGTKDEEKGAATPGSFRRANITLAKLGDITAPIIQTTDQKRESKNVQDKRAFNRNSAEGLASSSVPRSIRWTLGLSQQELNEESLKKLAEKRHSERERYRFMVTSLKVSEETNGKSQGSDSKETSPELKHAELKRMIEKDVERTYQDIQFFNTFEVKDLLSRILLVWCLKCGALGYRQGMNELLAVCLMAVKIDADHFSKNKLNLRQARSNHSRSFKRPDEKKDDKGSPKVNMENEGCDFARQTRVRAHTREFTALPDGLCDGDLFSIEADTFVLFRLLMQKMSPLYHSHPRDGRVEGGTCTAMEEGINGGVLGEKGIGSGSMKTPLDRRVYNVHHVMLRRLDPRLYFHLENFEVLPQLYMLRWLRLLFARETKDLDQLMVLLDTLLGKPEGFKLLDFVCLALVAALRNTLLTKAVEPAFVLSTLLKRHYIADAEALIKAAEILADDALLTRPAPAEMQVYNAPLQGNGQKLAKSRPGRFEVKRMPMEGYVVGCKSQTLYWCVLNGPRLMWYAEPSRRIAVAQTWLDGCSIVSLGKGILEIQSPSLPSSPPNKIEASDLIANSWVIDKNSQGTLIATKLEPQIVTNAKSSTETHTPMMTSTPDDTTTTTATTPFAARDTTNTSTTATAATPTASTIATATAPNTTPATTTTHAASKGSNAASHDPESTKITEIRDRVTAAIVNAPLDCRPSDNLAPVTTVAATQAETKEGQALTTAHAEPERLEGEISRSVLSVRLEVKDEFQYQQWLESLQEASTYSLRNQSMWRQCFS